MLTSVCYYHSLSGEHSFEEVLERSFDVSSVTPAWCETCQKYQATQQRRRCLSLPPLLALSCANDTLPGFTFWSTQLQVDPSYLFPRRSIWNQITNYRYRSHDRTPESHSCRSFISVVRLFSVRKRTKDLEKDPWWPELNLAATGWNVPDPTVNSGTGANRSRMVPTSPEYLRSTGCRQSSASVSGRKAESFVTRQITFQKTPSGWLFLLLTIDLHLDWL